MNKPDFSKYLDYEELTSSLREMVDAHPNLSTMYSIGKTYEGRDMWMVEITNREIGRPEKKPGMYIDGNHHAGEVTGSAVSLYTVWYLLENYGKDGFITDIVDNKVFYILPRISIDGAEIFLHTPYQMRSSVREYPPRDSDDGLNQEDINGDGWILKMRVKDPDGDWKVSDKDKRLMIRREPWDKEGQFYKIYPEGYVKNYDGKEVKVAQSKWGLDINRNYPAHWEPDVTQRGAGPYPLSEPETRSVAEFIVSHPNIGGAMSYHTTMGAILRPSCTRPDSKLPPIDVAIYKTLGKKGAKLTGYPDISTFEDYTEDKEHPLKGVFMDWLYDYQGIITFSTELWDASVRAGNPLFGRSGRSSEESQVALLTWNDRELAGNGFVDWQKFDHPELGEVEIGGWKSKFVLTNPPPQFLEGECHKNCLFTLYHAAALPCLFIEQALSCRLADGLYRVSAKVVNRSFMPTNTCRQAVAMGRVKPVTVRLESGEASSEPVIGKKKQEIGQLAGLSGPESGMGWFVASSNANEKACEWVIKGTVGQTITLVAESDRAGIAEVTVVLE